MNYEKLIKQKNVNREYKSDIMNKEELSETKEVDEEDQTVSFKIFLKNNNNLSWPEKRTKSILDNKSNIKTINRKDIVLNQLNQGMNNMMNPMMGNNMIMGMGMNQNMGRMNNINFMNNIGI